MEYIGIVEILGNWEFVDKLVADPYAKWTREQAEAIFDHMEVRAQHEGGHIELDLAAIRGDYDAFDSLEDIAKEYESTVDEVIDELEYDGNDVLQHDGAFVVYNPY